MMIIGRNNVLISENAKASQQKCRKTGRRTLAKSPVDNMRTAIHKASEFTTNAPQTTLIAVSL